MQNKAINTFSKILTIAGIIVVIIIAFFATVASQESGANYEPDYLNINYKGVGNEMNLEKYNTPNPVVAMEIDGYGSIVIELYTNVAENTVNNFISLVQKGFYDNNTFHRLMPGFVLQGGDPTGTGSGGPGYHIKGEFSANGYANNLKHTEGVVSMARSSSYDSAGSQFFIMLGTAEHLDGQYAAFGKVIDGLDNIKYIASTEKVANTQSGKLQQNLTIKKAVVDLKGKTYKEVEKVTN